MKPLELAGDFQELVRRKVLCKACRRVLPGTKAIDLEVQRFGLKRPDSLTFIAAINIAVARIDHLMDLGKDIVERDLYVGRLYLSSGKLVEHLVTIRGIHEVMLTGTRDVHWKKCPECEIISYYAKFGFRTLDSVPGPKAHIYTTQYCGLLFDQDFGRSVKYKAWQNVSIENINVGHVTEASIG